MMGNGKSDGSTSTDPPLPRALPCADPSKIARYPSARDSRGMEISILDDSGTVMGRKDSECGAMGDSTVHGTEGATTGPPTAML